jgi:hypothetical protein
MGKSVEGLEFGYKLVMPIYLLSAVLYICLVLSHVVVLRNFGSLILLEY